MAKKAGKRRPGRSRPKKTSPARKATPAASRTVAASPSALSNIALVGPNLLDGKGEATDRYLWSVVIDAPYAKRGDPIGQNFPVRPLAVDQSTVQVTYKQRRPFPLPPISKSVDFEPPPALHVAVRADGSAHFKLTVASSQSETSDYFSTDGGREVVAAPIGRYDKTSSDWPLQPLDEISLPVLGLVDGRVSIIIPDNNALFDLFSGLGVKQNVSGGAKSIIVDLTPLGFEFDGSLTLPFAKPSGQADPVVVAGRFSLTQERIGIWDQNSPTIVTQLCLRKVADPDATQAWNQIAVRLVSAGAAQWSSIERRAGAQAPTLRWAVGLDAQGISFEIDNTLLDLSPDAFTFIFSSTAGPNLRTRRPDGVAVLAPECLQMKFQVRSNQIDMRAFCPSRPDSTRHAVARAPPGVEYKYDGQTQTETIAIVSPTLSYQPRDLAQRLRDFYGIMPFDPATATPPLTPPPSAPPWLWAFTPVERGWVQFPVPNVPPLDPDDDAERIASLPSDTGGGASTGFARFSNRQEGAEPIPTLGGGGGDPPWSVSLDRADAFRGTWTLDASATYAPSKADIVFDAPQDVLPRAHLDQRRCAGAAGGAAAAERRAGQPRRHRLRYRRSGPRRCGPGFLARRHVDPENRRPSFAANSQLQRRIGGIPGRGRAERVPPSRGRARRGLGLVERDFHVEGPSRDRVDASSKYSADCRDADDARFGLGYRPARKPRLRALPVRALRPRQPAVSGEARR